MEPVSGALLLLLALVLVGVGYGLGRVWPAPPQQRPQRPPRPQRRLAPRETGVAPLSQAVVQRDSSDWLQREIDQRVQALRRAREHAEPWRPPAVDAVEAPEHAIWFADTAVEPHTPAGPR